MNRELILQTRYELIILKLFFKKWLSNKEREKWSASLISVSILSLIIITNLSDYNLMKLIIRIWSSMFNVL